MGVVNGTQKTTMTAALATMGTELGVTGLSTFINNLETCMSNNLGAFYTGQVGIFLREKHSGIARILRD